MIVGACHSTSALVINPCTIANSFVSWLQHAPCQSRRRRKGLAARVVLEGIGRFPLSAVWRSGVVNGGGADRPERTKRPGGASLLLPARGACPSGQWDPCEWPARSRRGLNRTAVAFQLQSVRAVVSTRRSEQ